MRAHIHLLSNDSRRETGDRRAGEPLPQTGAGLDLATGRPNLVDLRAVCTVTRIPLDLTRPDRTTPWLAGRVLAEQVGAIRGDWRMRVARRSRELASVASFHVADPDRRWRIESLGARDPEDGAAIDAVLRRAVIDAGAEGARRVFVNVPGDVTIDTALRRSGFVPFVNESVFMLLDGNEASTGGPSSMVRRVHPADVWGIHQLYLEVVPRQVQYAEAVTSRSWERSRPLRPGARRSSGWVIEDRGRIRGYVRVSTEEDPRVVRLDMLIDPTARALADDLLAASVSEARNLHGTPCVIAVPGYSQELSHPVRNAGFFHVGDQTAWVCYTTVPARSYIVAVDLGVPVSAEAQGSRVPGFGGASMSLSERANGNPSTGDLPAPSRNNA
jgi:hypothetical protein